MNNISQDEKIMKQKHLHSLCGYIREGNHAMVNGVILEFISPVNIYQSTAEFFKDVIDAHLDIDDVRAESYVMWLMGKGWVKLVDDSDVNAILPITHYQNHPFTPAYKDVMWTVRVLRQHLERLTPRMVYILSLYKETDIHARQVKEEVISRDMDRIIELIEMLEISHDQHIKNIMLYQSTKDSSLEPCDP